MTGSRKTTRRWLRPVRLLGGLLGGALLVSGCGFTGLYGLPLPGAVTGSFHIRAIFDDVMDLVPQSAVKVADVTVGSVEKISLTPQHKALVEMSIESSVHLPANTIAILQETSLLGEKFVELGPPPGVPPVGTLPDNALLQDGSTVAYPDVETVFGALSAVLNGGGLGNLQTISYEVAEALSGREVRVKDLLSQLNEFVGNLNTQRSEIVRALDATDQLTAELAAQRSTIATALDDLGPGLKVLADERGQLVQMLQGLSQLGLASTRVIDASASITGQDLRLLQPILSRINAAGAALPQSLDLLLDYPFPQSSVAGIPGDYSLLYATLQADCSLSVVLQQLGQLGTIPQSVLDKLLGGLGISTPHCPSVPPKGSSTGSTSGGSGGHLPNPLSGLPGVTSPLNVLPGLPGLPSVPSLPGGTVGGGSSGGVGGTLGNLLGGGLQ